MPATGYVPGNGEQEPEVSCMAFGCVIMLLSAITMLYILIEVFQSFRR